MEERHLSELPGASSLRSARTVRINKRIVLALINVRECQAATEKVVRRIPASLGAL